MAGASAPDELCRLRETIENIQAFQFDSPKSPLPLGIAEADATLGGGLAYGALHELSPAGPIDLGAACGFALALGVLAAKAQRNAKAGRDLLWIQTDFAALEGGALYAPGFELFGLPAHRLLVLRTARAADVLFAMEEALKCRGLASVIAEMPDDGASLTATRRLSLAAQAGDGFGVLLRHRTDAQPSAAMTRWAVKARAGPRDAFGGLGATCFELSLVKNRHGPCGRWSFAWNHHERVFESAADPVAMAAPASGRPADAAIA